MKAIARWFAPMTLAFGGCTAAAPPVGDDAWGGSVAVLVDRSFGSWKKMFADGRGTMLGSPAREQRAKIEVDGHYLIELGFLDGRTARTELDFAVGTPISEVTTTLAEALRRKGLEVVAVPEFGALRIRFTEGLCSITASGPDGFTVEDHEGKRSDLSRDGLDLREITVVRG